MVALFTQDFRLCEMSVKNITLGAVIRFGPFNTCKALSAVFHSATCTLANSYQEYELNYHVIDLTLCEMIHTAAALLGW